MVRLRTHKTSQWPVVDAATGRYDGRCPTPPRGATPMERREWLKSAGFGAAAGLPALANADFQPAPPAALRRLGNLKIFDIKTILTAPAGIRLVVVKVVTNEPGLYGLGCATFTQRARVVETAVDKYLKPFLVGKD